VRKKAGAAMATMFVDLSSVQELEASGLSSSFIKDDDPFETYAGIW
jgi:hypothetical protein